VVTGPRLNERAALGRALLAIVRSQDPEGTLAFTVFDARFTVRLTEGGVP
jgi:hypothetical protein